jgi:hypothetical protein
MIRSLTLLLAGVLVVALLAGGQSAAAKPPPSRTCDDVGNCAPPPPPPPPPSPSPPAPPPPPAGSDTYWYPDGWYYESDGAGSPYIVPKGSGCDVKVVTKTARSVLFRSVIFRLHLRVNWCWQSPHITSLAVNCWVSDVDRFTITYTECKLNGWYFAWGGSAKGGRYQQGQATFSNCLIRYGCWRNDLVTLKFWAYANGAWRAET